MKDVFTASSKISEAQFQEILRLYAMDLNASQIAELLNINRNTVNRYVMAIRRKVALHCHRGCYFHWKIDSCKIENIKGIRGRNPSRHNTVICLLEEQGCVYTEIVPARLTALMQAIMRRKVRADSVLDAIGLQHCKAIANLNSKRIFHIPGDEAENNVRRTTIIPVDRFWGTFKQRLVKMRGIDRTYLPYHLKECEFRFNNAQQEIFGLLQALIGQDRASSLDKEN